MQWQKEPANGSRLTLEMKVVVKLNTRKHLRVSRRLSPKPWVGKWAGHSCNLIMPSSIQPSRPLFPSCYSQFHIRSTAKIFATSAFKDLNQPSYIYSHPAHPDPTQAYTLLLAALASWLDRLIIELKQYATSSCEAAGGNYQKYLSPGFASEDFTEPKSR